jgi:hypothetical protein
MEKTINKQSSPKIAAKKANIGKQRKYTTTLNHLKLSLSRAVDSGNHVTYPTSASMLALISSSSKNTLTSSLSKKTTVSPSLSQTTPTSSMQTSLTSPKFLKGKPLIMCSLSPEEVKVKLQPQQINYFNAVKIKEECIKYLNNIKDLPRPQEVQLSFLLNKFPLSDLKIAFTVATTKVDNSAMKIYYPLPNTKKKIIAIFLGLILDSRSIIGDVSKDTYRSVLIALFDYVLHCCLKTNFSNLELFVQCIMLRNGIQSQFRFTNY